ncbi:MAG: protease inhibitor I42 family protein [Chloroflexota bacterium]
MKKFWLLVTGILLVAYLVAGCAGEVKTYTDAGQAISINSNQEFAIALDSNPTTGYSWQESHDEAMLKLVKKTYEQGEQAKKGLVGAGGIDYFRFQALKAGETKITLIYKRPWETDSIDLKVFTVTIR